MNDKVLELHAQGKSQRDIASALGISQSKVNRTLKARRKQSLTADLSEVLHAAEWIEEQEQCLWPSAVNEFLGRDASAALKALQKRGMIGQVNTQSGEHVYVLTDTGRAPRTVHSVAQPPSIGPSTE